MDTTERMMIMGMCLQGLLANPNLTQGRASSGDPTVDARLAEAFAVEIDHNVKLAHLYADRLDPPPVATNAQQIMAFTRVAYEVLRAADADGAAKWPPFDAARASCHAEHADDLDGVFERVSRWFHDPTGFPETIQDRLIAAVVAASKGAI